MTKENTMMKSIVIVFAVLSIFGMNQAFAESYPGLGVKVDTVAENLSIPWSIDFAPDGRIFFSERTGTLNVIDGGVQKQIMTLDVGNGEGGMLGIALDPNFETNHYIYIYYTYNELFAIKNKLVRYIESGNTLTEDKTLLDDIPGASYHDGGRIQFGPDGKLYITTGDAGEPNFSQSLDSVAGKILRINSDGTVPKDNPWKDSPVYSIGHRNPQGIDWDANGNLVATEHGPSGWRGSAHDEINVIIPGTNYGWPDVIGDETMEGLQNPILHTGDDTWAPSGAEFYEGNKIPQWTGKYFVAALRGSHLHMIDFDLENNKVVSHEKLFQDEFGRLRDVQTGPDGFLYILTSNQDGRGSPANNDDRILRITSLYETENMPGWMSDVFVWFGNGEISEQEIIHLIEYLTGLGGGGGGVSQDCSGTAGCITGVVTQIIDGDTIKVDGNSIRFALASAPELNESGGVNAREFIQTICPVGSSVLVDEDDGQRQGSYGRILGVIYCNGMNLNEELLDANLGYLSSGFCQSSEFSEESWAQKHGCES